MACCAALASPLLAFRSVSTGKPLALNHPMDACSRCWVSKCSSSSSVMLVSVRVVSSPFRVSSTTLSPICLLDRPNTCPSGPWYCSEECVTVAVPHCRRTVGVGARATALLCGALRRRTIAHVTQEGLLPLLHVLKEMGRLVEEVKGPRETVGARREEGVPADHAWEEGGVVEECRESHV